MMIYKIDILNVQLVKSNLNLNFQLVKLLKWNFQFSVHKKQLATQKIISLNL